MGTKSFPCLKGLRRGINYPLISRTQVKERRTIPILPLSNFMAGYTVTSTFNLTQPPSFTIRYKHVKERLDWILKHTGLTSPAAPLCERAHEPSGSTKVVKFLGELTC
jgi:hypothetical protein